MGFAVVLDACVLYPASLRDTLLRLAEVELFDVKWSSRILEEAARNLVADQRMTQDQAEHLMRCMDEAFEDASVSADAVAALEPVMANERKDRHVLAAAVSCGAQHLITTNLEDFPVQSAEPYGVEAVHPDDFLVAMLDLDAVLVLDVLQRQAADLQHPPKTIHDILQALSVNVPTFVARVREHLQCRERQNHAGARGGS